MARNPYFSHGARSEQALYEDIVIEALKRYGHDMYYLPRSIVEVDSLLKEDILSKYTQALALEAYIENVDGYGGDGSLMSKFGLEIRDQMTVVISRRRWLQAVSRFNTQHNLDRPAEGDLVYFPMGNALMEIKYVDNKSPFYQLKNLPTYKLTLESFEYTAEKLDTGVTEIDKFELLNGSRTNIALTSITGTFSIGETVRQVVSGSKTVIAEVAAFSGTTLSVVSPVASDGSNPVFSVGTITGVSSGATGMIASTENIQALEESDPSAQNKVFEDEAEAVVDFSESNPFGDITLQN